MSKIARLPAVSSSAACLAAQGPAETAAGTPPLSEISRLLRLPASSPVSTSNSHGRALPYEAGVPAPLSARVRERIERWLNAEEGTLPDTAGETINVFPGGLLATGPNHSLEVIPGRIHMSLRGRISLSCLDPEISAYRAGLPDTGHPAAKGQLFFTAGRLRGLIAAAPDSIRVGGVWEDGALYAAGIKESGGDSTWTLLGRTALPPLPNLPRTEASVILSPQADELAVLFPGQQAGTSPRPDGFVLSRTARFPRGQMSCWISGAGGSASVHYDLQHHELALFGRAFELKLPGGVFSFGAGADGKQAAAQVLYRALDKQPVRGNGTLEVEYKAGAPALTIDCGLIW